MSPQVIAAFTLGCACVLWAPDRWPLAALLPVLLLALLKSIRPWMLALLIGALWTEWQVSQRLSDRWPTHRHGEEVRLRAVVSGLPERRDGAGGLIWRFELQPDAAARADGIPVRLRVSGYGIPQQLAVGDCGEWTLRLRSPRGSHNPGGFDYEGWLFREGIGATATVRAVSPCAVAPTLSPMTRVHRLRAALLQPLETELAAHPGRPLLAALGLGDGRGLGDDHWTVLRQTGTSHLVVISGLHLALVSALAFGLFRLLWPLLPGAALRWPTPWAAGLGAALVATAYALLAGLQTPVLRALLMVWLALWLARRGGWQTPFRSLLWVWGVVVALDPMVLLRPGLWLSFGAVAGILWLTALRARRPPAWRVFLLIQLGLGLLLAPLTLLFFDGATLLSPLANLIAVPVFTVLTPLAVLAVLMASTWPLIGLPLLRLVADLLALAWQGLVLLSDALPGAWWAAAPDTGSALLALFGVVLLLAPRGLPTRALGLLCCLPLLWPTSTAPSRGFTLAMLDVGQGLAAVVRTAHHTLVYDAGPAWPGGFDAGAGVVVPYLQVRGVNRIDRLLLSHGDRDHAGGVPAVRAALPVASLLGTADSPRCESGHAWVWDGVQFTVLHPPPRAGPRRRDRNNDSCVLRIDGPQGSALLAGDIEASAEQALLARQGAAALKAEVLVAPHHGSRTSSTEALVDAVAPAWVLFGAGWRHHFGHPHPTVEMRWRDTGSSVGITGDAGALEIRWDDDGHLRMQAWRQVHRWRWTSPVQP